MARVFGNKQPLMNFKNGSGTLTELGADVVTWGWADGEGNPVTMADYQAGVTPEKLTVTFVLDFSATSAHEYFHTNAGATGVTYNVSPTTGTVSQTNPKWTGTCTMPKKPQFEIDASTEATTFDVEIALDNRNRVIV